MDHKGIAKARRKLDRMQRAVEALESADSPGTMEDAWGDFIMAAGTFNSALEQGAKTNTQSKAWFGRKKHQRRTDPLLKYIHHARNAEEHGIALITKRTNSNITLKSQGAAVVLKSDGRRWNVTHQTGDVEYPMDQIALVRVHDSRFGDSFDPPEHHLGQKIDDISPTGVAKLAFAYFAGLLDEAVALS